VSSSPNRKVENIEPRPREGRKLIERGERRGGGGRNFLESLKETGYGGKEGRNARFILSKKKGPGLTQGNRECKKKGREWGKKFRKKKPTFAILAESRQRERK